MQTRAFFFEGDHMKDSPFSFLTRRRVLTMGLGSAGALGVAVAVRNRSTLPGYAGLSALDPRRFHTLTLLALTHLPVAGSYPISATEMDIARKMDGFLADETTQNVADLSTALTLVELGPLLFDASFASFSRLEPARRLAHWKSWGTSRLLTRRQVAVAFRKFFSMVYFDSEAVWPNIGYPGPSLRER